LENLGKLSEGKFQRPRSGKGFNFVSAWSLFGYAESRFVEPRISLQGRTDLFFSLVRKEPKVPQRFANLWTPGTIQSSAENSFEEAFRRHVSKPVFRKKSGEKALNRCDVPVLQREDLERTTKEWPCFLRTVGYGWVGICGVWSEKGLLWIAKRKGLCKRTAFGL